MMARVPLLLCVALSCLAVGLAAAALAVSLTRDTTVNIDNTPACTGYGCR